MAEQPVTDLQGQMSCIPFTLAEPVHSINLMRVREVPREIGVMPRPGAAHYATGIISLQDQYKLPTEAEFRQTGSF